MAKTLAGISISRSGEDYLIRLEDEGGSSAEYTASYDQLDLLAEAVEEQLDNDEEDALGYEDEEAEETETDD